MAQNSNNAPQGQYPPPQGQYYVPPPQGQFPAPQAPYPQPQVQYPVPQGQYPAGVSQGVQYQQQPPHGQFVGQPPTAVGQQPALPYPPSGQNQIAPTAGGKAPWDPSQATTYSGNDIAADDVDENAAEEQVSASAPGYDLVISGYENAAVANAPAGPPPSYEAAADIPALVDSSRIPALTADVARDALLGFVAQQSCWGKGAAESMDIKEVLPTNAYHYILETCTEGRITCPACLPYAGGPVDGPHNGAAPLPWEIPCTPTTMFQTEQHQIAVPHTEAVKQCHLCLGRGFIRCGKCFGRGRVRCNWCHGTGNRRVHRNDQWQNERCHSCHGSGRKQCNPCRGSGCIVCYVCSGYGSVKQFIQLTVAFTNRHSEHILERTDLPDELIRKVEGDTIFEQTLPRVRAIENFFDDEINHKSKEMVNMHATSWPLERVLQQRHYLRSVPVHECHFKYSGEKGRFWVYGNNKEVYTKDYPHTCCCCRCAIL